MKLINLLACIFLSACGFKLQDKPVNLAGKNFAVVNHSGNKPIATELINRINLSGGATDSVNSSPKRSIRIELDNFNIEKRVLSSGSYGQGQIFIVSSCIDIRVNNSPKSQICARRRISEDYNQQLSNLNAMSNMNTFMQHDLVTLILLKIGSNNDNP